VKKRIVLPGGNVAQVEQFDSLLKKRAAPLDPVICEKTLPVTDFYERQVILARVDADRGAEPVFNDVSRLIIE